MSEAAEINQVLSALRNALMTSMSLWSRSEARSEYVRPPLFLGNAFAEHACNLARHRPSKSGQ